MHLSTRIDATFPQPPEVVWPAAASLENLPRTFGPVAPIPGVARAEVEGGGELGPGKVRLVHLTDGTTSREEILALQAPSVHRYRLHGLGAPFSWIVREGEADWRFSADGPGTRLAWTYTFHLTTPLMWPVAWVVLKLFHRAMEGNVAGIRRLLEGREAR